MSKGSSSDAGVNAFRFVTMFTVVLAHAWMTNGIPIRSGDPSYLLLVTAQCSVPTFFITSGFLLRWREGDALAVTRWSLRKLLPLYVLWAGFYLAFAWAVGSLTTLRTFTAFGGSTLPLWFIPALGFALSTISVSLRKFGLRWTWIIAGAVAIFGLFNGTYQTFLGLEANPFRAAVLLAPLLVLVGVQIRLSNPPRSLVWFGLAAIVVFWLQVMDNRFIATAAGYSVDKRPSTTLATFFYALSVFLFARSIPATKAVEWLARRKRYLLIIYCIHPLVLTAFAFVGTIKDIPSLLAVTIVGFALSALAATAFAGARRRYSDRAAMQRPIQPAVEA
jgi:surface polysaccharide O-acyltransferase-like enzyme